jgi:hypothetical protein
LVVWRLDGVEVAVESVGGVEVTGNALVVWRPDDVEVTDNSVGGVET